MAEFAHQKSLVEQLLTAGHRAATQIDMHKHKPKQCHALQQDHDVDASSNAICVERSTVSLPCTVKNWRAEEADGCCLAELGGTDTMHPAVVFPAFSCCRGCCCYCCCCCLLLFQPDVGHLLLSKPGSWQVHALEQSCTQLSLCKNLLFFPTALHVLSIILLPSL